MRCWFNIGPMLAGRETRESTAITRSRSAMISRPRSHDSVGFRVAFLALQAVLCSAEVVVRWMGVVTAAIARLAHRTSTCAGGLQSPLKNVDCCQMHEFCTKRHQFVPFRAGLKFGLFGFSAFLTTKISRGARARRAVGKPGRGLADCGSGGTGRSRGRDDHCHRPSCVMPAGADALQREAVRGADVESKMFRLE